MGSPSFLPPVSHGETPEPLTVIIILVFLALRPTDTPLGYGFFQRLSKKPCLIFLGPMDTPLKNLQQWSTSPPFSPKNLAPLIVTTFCSRFMPCLYTFPHSSCPCLFFSVSFPLSLVVLIPVEDVFSSHQGERPLFYPFFLLSNFSQIKDVSPSFIYPMSLVPTMGLFFHARAF